jgi:hypothetical protein
MQQRASGGHSSPLSGMMNGFRLSEGGKCERAQSHQRGGLDAGHSSDESHSSS